MHEPRLAARHRSEVLCQCLSAGIATRDYGINFGTLSVSSGLNL